MRILLAALFLRTSLHAAAEPAATVPSIVQQWVEAQQHVGDISVDFRLTKTLPTLKEPITSDGHFWKLADGQFRWEMGSPATTVLLFDNKVLHMWDAEKKSWQTLSATDNRMRMWMQFLNSKEMNAEAMTKTFTPTVTSEQPDVVTVALQPKGLIVRKHLKQVDLQIDPKTKYLRQVRLLQSDDASVIMTFATPRPMATADKARILLPDFTKTSP
ncbi:MAG: Outer rane lipoproteinsorting protein [Verrucomicrobiaceae bacterium]|nr:Outer rane lipoproteinsorting protein [Verrucomicrobiaceae bacterium]